MKKVVALVISLVMLLSVSLALAEGFAPTPIAIAVPEFAPAEVEAGAKTYNPVEEFSEETADGPIWKYMYFNGNSEDAAPQLLTALNESTVGVWRVGDLDDSFKWAGVGRSTDFYPDHQYFEMNTDTGSLLYGLLVFVAPEAGTYTIPEFRYLSTGEGIESAVIALKNGELAFNSEVMGFDPDAEEQFVMVPEQTLELAAGDSLIFYVERYDGMYVFGQLDGLTINYTPAE